jgi:hypothetical protein
MEQVNQFLSGLNRAQIVRWTAIYLAIYVVINSCAGLVFGVVGALSATAGALSEASGFAATGEGTAATSSLVAIGGLSVILGILYLISVPVCGIAAFGLFRRKSWARTATVVALGFTILISLVGLSNSFSNIIWAIISAFALYLFWSDAGIKQELSQ